MPKEGIIQRWPKPMPNIQKYNNLCFEVNIKNKRNENNRFTTQISLGMFR